MTWRSPNSPRATAMAALAGLIFGGGLIVSGMTRPDKVQGFLDVTGAWDPSLAFVMIGAIAVHFLLFRLILRRRSPLFDKRFHLPTRTDLDPKLVAGAAIFGVGWGLGGICPGPALVDLGSGVGAAAVFVVAMALGMTLQRFSEHVRKRPEAIPAGPAPQEAPPAPTTLSGATT